MKRLAAMLFIKPNADAQRHLLGDTMSVRTLMRDTYHGVGVV